MCKIIKNLSGHSGCSVLLCQDEHKMFFVRKISSSVEYNKRLFKQYLKQKKFIKSIISTPSIYKYGYINELFFFDMEYIHGNSLSNIISLIPLEKIYFLLKIIINNINKSFICNKNNF